MTLRARLTGAFLAVVMGPVLVGGVFVARTVDSVNDTHQREQLDLAVFTTRTVISTACDRLQTIAETAATTTAAGTEPQLAQTLVDQGLASAIRIETAGGSSITTTASPPSPPWALCTPLSASSTAPPGDPSIDGSYDGSYTALAAVAEMRDPSGNPAGYAYAAQTLSPAFMAGLATAAGAEITIMSVPAPASGPSSRTAGARITAFAATLSANQIGQDRSRYIRRIDPSGGQPLRIAVAVPVRPAGDLQPIVIAIAGFAAIAAVVAAWALARTATKRLDEIAEAAERIAEGDLDTRVPVRHDDEVGHVGAALNRLSREMRCYSAALSNSREQLRDNLGVLGDTLASTHDLPRILHVMLASAIASTGAQAGVVVLADPDSGHLRTQCAEGFDADGLARLAALDIAPGVGLLGAVASSGAARRGRTGEQTTGPAPIDAEPACRTYLAVPLRSPAASPSLAASTSGAGVLVLYDRLGDDEFDDTDLRTVRSFASHAAIAVDNVHKHAEAQRLSHTDPLTGLYNYRYLKDLVRREVDRSSRFGRSLCVIALDLDRFKQVNDSHGHAAGDAVLIEFAQRIGVEIRAVDLAFRYGGEEFVVLLPETDGLGGVTLAQRLNAAIRESSFTVPGRLDSGVDIPVDVTVSIGVAVYPEHGATGTQLLEAADDALYAAKAAGRDTYRIALSRPVVAELPENAAEPIVTAAGGARPAGGGFSRWHGRETGRPSGGASGTAPPPRQPPGR